MPDQKCHGVLGTDKKCKLSRVTPGGPISIRGKCVKCGERRCRAHCRCGRTGSARGRAAARSKRAVTATATAATSNAEHDNAVVVGPIGRPSALGVSILSIGIWWQQMMKDVEIASDIMLASYTYDHSSLTALLIRRLQGRAAFSVTVLVDKESFDKGDAPRERPRLRALREAGARIFMCRGTPPFGRMHVKAICIDRRTVYTGSANFTNKSASNLEMVMRMVGPPADDIKAQLADIQNGGKLWDGA